MKKAIVTGATSFIGRNLIKRLVDANWKVYAVIRKENIKDSILFSSANVEVISLVMEEYSNLAEYIKEPCDAYVSLAWSGTRGMQRDDKNQQEKNYVLSMLALEAVKNIGCKVVISAGSQAEYGLMTKEIKENDNCEPNTEYGKWKLEYYKNGMEFCKDNKIAFKEPRFFSLYGEDDYEKTMVLSILNNMLENRPCKLTKCIQLWDFLYIDDAIDGMLRLMECECDNGAYNFGSGDIRPLKDYVMEMYRITGTQSELMFGAVPYPLTGIVNACPNICKLKEQTGWTPKISFEEGIRRIITYKQKVLRIRE